MKEKNFYERLDTSFELCGLRILIRKPRGSKFCQKSLIKPVTALKSFHYSKEKPLRLKLITITECNVQNVQLK